MIQCGLPVVYLTCEAMSARFLPNPSIYTPRGVIYSISYGKEMSKNGKSMWLSGGFSFLPVSSQQLTSEANSDREFML